jgi:hypothetical protein
MRRSLLPAVLACCLLMPAAASAQPEPAAPPSDPAADTARGPAVHFRGFADLNFAATDNHLSDDGKSHDGFSLGNLVGHVSSSLGGKFSFFGEVNVTGHDSTFSIDVARAFIRYDYNDRFKISAGRYHAPIGYWNVAFHRGLWLQTTIFRPDIIKEEWFQPDHFVGVMAEGMLVSRVGLGYIAGYGNGRDSDLRPMGLQAGDFAGTEGSADTAVGHHRAGVVRLFARPPQWTGVEFGGAVYKDELAVIYTRGVPELITSAYLAITRETPEILVEFSNLRHSDYYADHDSNSQAFYVQLAYRIPQQPRWKPYGRFEKATAPFDEPVTGNLSNSKTTVGVRFELTDFATLKVEYGQRRRPGADHVNGVFAQTAFTF